MHSNCLEKVKFCLLLCSFLLLLYLINCRMFLVNDFSGRDWPMRMRVSTIWPPPPLILTWTGFFDRKTAMEWLLEQNDVSHCPYLCRYSGDRSLEANASVLIFHIRDELRPLPVRRSPNQIYTFFLLESPVNSGNQHKNVPPDFFNISMTYRADSDVFYPYDAFDEFDWEAGEESGEQKMWKWSEDEVTAKVNGKSDLALQIVSNCGTSSRRESYMDELKKHLNITQKGSCVGKACDEKCAQKLMDSHFFYLALENSVCKNYVTEKFWHIKRLIVPVVLSRKVFDGMHVPAEAFIAADDLGSAEELAEHLKMVAGNKQLYRNHLQWTRKYKRTEHRRETLNPLCQLCKLANEMPKKERRMKNIVDFWEFEGQCQDRFAERLLPQKDWWKRLYSKVF